MKNGQKLKLVSFVAAAVLIIGFALTASAQVNYQVSSTPTNVIQTGLTEVLGEVRLTKNNPPTGAPQTTIAGTITVLYQNVPIANTFTGQRFVSVNGGGAGLGQYADPGGITITTTGGFNNTGVGISVDGNPAGTGGLLTLFIPPGLTIEEADIISINGVRAMMTGLPANTDVNASVQSKPPNAHQFNGPFTVRVARAFAGLLVGVSANTIGLTEGFPGAFVQYVVGAATGKVPSAPRPLFGANSNTQINIVSSQMAGIAWPQTILATSGVGTLDLLSVSPEGGDSVYEFTTTNQGASDSGIETFVIVLPVCPKNSQAQLYPATGDRVPRFEDPLKPDPVAEINLIISRAEFLVTSGVLNQGQGHSLKVKLQVAIEGLEEGNADKAIRSLRVFINQVNSFVNEGILSGEEGQALIARAGSIISLLSCE
jgi:hypothetical protein